MYGNAFCPSLVIDPTAFTAGIGGFCEGNWCHYPVQPEDANVLDITKLEVLTFSVNMQLFGPRLPPPNSGLQVALHGDRLASVLDMQKLKVNSDT